MSQIYVLTYDEPPINKKEILRYAGVRGEHDAFDTLLDECLAKIRGRLRYSVCYGEFAFTASADALDFGFMRTDSKGLKKNLSGCNSAVIFAATVGIEIDRLIARYSAISPTKALFFQSIGAERIESLCDVFNKEISEKKAAEGFITRPRFSAGYGDLPLELQRDIFGVLDCPKRIGLSLNESLLMSPSKSVTAMIGIEKAEDNNENNGIHKE